MIEVQELFFQPPLAIARLGGSDTPLENFRWVTDLSPYATQRTTIHPAVTLEITDDGTPLAYKPRAIRFRDAGKLRPVAPFFELWIRIREGEKHDEKPLTLDLLRKLGLGTADLRFRISVANKKAQRRVQSASCGFVARVDARGDDHARKPLLAHSPHDPVHEPLVRRDAPVPLGAFQVIRPRCAVAAEVDLSVVRVRYTPAKGEVYGPPSAVASMPSPLPEGENLVWAKVMQGRMHEIVRQENRILNPNSLWSRYILSEPGRTDPMPSDSYDGAKLGNQQAWGVVDDTCDGVLEAHLVHAGNRLSAYARVMAGPPDYAPDRRAFVSVADDLADRDLPLPALVNEHTREITEDEIGDLFNRVFETATQINLDAERYKFVGRQPDQGPGPKTDLRSMTKHDEPYADLSKTFINDEDAITEVDIPRRRLPFTDMARHAHLPLTDIHDLLEFFRTRADHVRRIVRAPFGRFDQLSAAAASQPNDRFRDPRLDRDTLYDMRMPPYMRDSDAAPLSLTWRQYEELMDLVDLLASPAAAPASAQAPVPGEAVTPKIAAAAAKPAASPTPAPTTRARQRPAHSRIERRVATVLASLDRSKPNQ